MKALGTSERLGLPPFVSQQIYYSLQGREAEYELVPLAVDQGLGILVWSPLAGGLLSGKYRRGQQPPEGSRHLSDWGEPPVYDQEGVYDIITLSDDERAQLDAASAPPLIYPYWHQAKTARDRLSAADLTLLAPHLK